MDLYGQLTGSSRPAGPAPDRFPGVVVALVTDTRDPDKIGRVRVSYPWLSDQVQSSWARVVGVGAGAGRGVVMLPEVDDEVLVAFEHGRIDSPYVLGGLWSKIDKPPAGGDKPNDVRQITSRSGHTIRLDDTAGAERIEITSGTGKSTIVLDGANNTLTIRTDGDLVLESRGGAVTITGRTVEVKADQRVSVEATEVKVAAKAALELGADAKAELKAGGPLKVQGAVVNIN